MKSFNLAGALLLVAVCGSVVSGQTCTSADYDSYTDGTDFYGNDLTSIPSSTPDACIAACEANDACFAIVLKASGICYLKNDMFYSDVRDIANTDLAVDMSCLRGGAPPLSPVVPGPSAPGTPPGSPTTPDTPPSPGTPTPEAPAGTPPDGTGTDTPPAGVPPVTNDDGTVTVTSIAEVAGGKYVTTEVKYNPKNFNSDTTDDVADSVPTATSYYSDASGAQVTGEEAIANPEVTVEGPVITATTTVADQTDPIVTTVTTDPTTGAEAGVTSTGGVTEEPATPPGATPPSTPPGSEGTIGTDAATGYTTMSNTVMVPNTAPPKYVTMNTTVDGELKEVPGQSVAYYSDENGAPVDPPVNLTMTTTSDPAAVYPAPIVTSSVNATDDSGASQMLTSSAYKSEDGTLTTYGANPLDLAAAPGTPSGMTTPPTGLGAAPPPPSRSVNVTTTPESGSATGLQMLSAVFAISMFGALML